MLPTLTSLALSRMAGVQATAAPVSRIRGFDLSCFAARIVWMILAAAITYSLLWTIGKDEEFQSADFGAYYRAGRAIAGGHSPYVASKDAEQAASGYASAYAYLLRRQGSPNEVAGDTFVYAPAYAYLFWPLSQLDYVTSARLWMLLNWGATLVCVWLGLLLVVGPGRPVPWGLLLLALLPAAGFFWANIRTGQVGTIMLACCLAWAACARHGKPFLGGLLLAAGCALKLSPVLLVPYLAIRRDVRGLAGVFAGAILLFLIPAPWTGFTGSVHLHLDWLRHMGATQVPIQTYRPMNQSCLGLLARLPWVSNGGTCWSLENLHMLERWYPIVPLALAIALYAWIVRNRRRASDEGRGDQERERRDNVHLALLLALMTVLHPRAWVFNFVALFPMCLIVSQCVWERRPRWATALAALAFVLFTSCLSWSTPYDREWSLSVWLLQGKFFWQALVLAAVCWWSRFPERASQAITPSNSANLFPV